MGERLQKESLSATKSAANSADLRRVKSGHPVRKPRANRDWIESWKYAYFEGAQPLTYYLFFSESCAELR